MGYCCIPCCKTTQRKGISFHKFPTSIDSKRKWISIISQQGNPRNCNWTPTGRSTICSQHFKDNDYSISTTKKILLPSAVPSIFEDLVGLKMARRQKRANLGKNFNQNRLTKTKKPSTKVNSSSSAEESVKRGRGRPKKVKDTTNQLTVTPNEENPVENSECFPAKIRKSVRDAAPKKPSEKNLPLEKEVAETATDISEDMSEITASTKNVNSENMTMLVDDDTSECATLPLTEEYSATGSECDRSESIIDSAPHSTTIKISKSLQSVLRKLITTIENQRAEISKLKKERDSLNRQIYNLKKEQIKHVYVSM